MSPTWSHTEVDGLLNLCKWIWDISHGSSTVEDEMSSSAGTVLSTASVDSDGDTIMSPVDSRPPMKILIHCPDGYTESSLLALTYTMYAHYLPVATAWISLHKDRGRNFFAYATDVALLTAIQPRILASSPSRKIESPACDNPLKIDVPEDPEWLTKFDGSLPSRVLPYMYLGNLNHANNPGLLGELGIGRIVSVGERVSWADSNTSSSTSLNSLSEVDKMSVNNGFEFVVVENVQDNGVDGLSVEFERCLEFIGRLLFYISKGVY
jgi:dual specificity MAP kinase phosphatase